MRTHNYISKLILLMGAMILMTRHDAFAQFSVKPDWVNDPPLGYVNYYLVGLGISPNYQQSVQYAIANAAQTLQTHYDIESATLIDKTPISDYSRVLVFVHGQKTTILLKVVDSFVEQDFNGNYETHVLVSTPRPLSDIRSIPDDLGAFFRSTLIPGWGQAYKGYRERGMIFLLFEGIAVGVTAVMYHKAISTADTRFRSTFDVTLGITLGLHILDMIDSATIKPNIQYE